MADGHQLASSSEDKTVQDWNAITGERLRTIHGLSDAVVGVTYRPDGLQLATASLDKTARLQPGWRAPGGLRLASGSWDQTVRVWDVAAEREVLTLRGHTDRI